MEDGFTSGLLAGQNNGGNTWDGIFGIIALLALAGGGFGNWGGNRGGSNDYSNELQTSILENSANQRQTCMDFANTNSNIVNGNYQTQNAVNGGFAQTARDICSASNGIVSAINANELNTQNQIAQLAQQNATCCCDIQRQIDGVNYNTSQQVQSIKDMLAEQKIETLQNQVNALQLQSALCNVVRYPNSITFNGGASPFCTNCC